MWNDANREIVDIFLKSNKIYIPPFQCPICKTYDAHLYMYRWKQDTQGSIWTWCSTCKASAHERVILPDWWKNAIIIDDNLLGVYPDMLEENKQFVDEYVSQLLKGIYPNELEQETIKAKYYINRKFNIL